MTRLNWHKWPDEKPDDERGCEIVTYWKGFDGKPIVAMKHFDGDYEAFYCEYNTEEYMTARIYAPDDCVEYWIHINELPLPQQGDENDRK